MIGNNSVSLSSLVRNIGAMFDAEMKMDVQVSAVSSWFHLYQISKIRKYLTQDQTKTIVHAYITSKLDQNNSLLSGIPEYLIEKLQRLQNAAAKVIYRAKKYDHVTNLLFELHWLPIHHRISFKILLITFKTLHGEGPSYLKDMLIWHKANRNLCSNNNLLWKIPKTRLKSYVDRAFGSSAPWLWNSLSLLEL